MAGALLLGYFFARFREHPRERLAHPFLSIGICGTLTTFSTMQLELYELLDGGHLGLAAAYCAATIAAGYLCVRLGIVLASRRPRAIGVSALGWVAVGLLGGLAAAARFALDAEIAARAGSELPLGILVVNVAGSLALGLVAGAALNGEALAIVAGGGIGSFTTFSTWILDSHRLAAAGLARLAWLNIGGSLLAGFAAVALGHWLGAAL